MRAAIICIVALMTPSVAGLVYEFEEMPGSDELLVYPGQEVRLDVSVIAHCQPAFEVWAEPKHIVLQMEAPAWVTTTRSDEWTLEPNVCSGGQTFYQRAYWDFTVDSDAVVTTDIASITILEDGQPVQRASLQIGVRLDYDLSLFFEGSADLVGDGNLTRTLIVAGAANSNLGVQVRAVFTDGPISVDGGYAWHEVGSNETRIPFHFQAPGQDPGYVVVRADVRHYGATLLSIDRNYTFTPAPINVLSLPSVAGEEVDHETEPLWWPWLIAIVGLVVIAVAVAGRRLSTTSESDES